MTLALLVLIVAAIFVQGKLFCIFLCKAFSVLKDLDSF